MHRKIKVALVGGGSYAWAPCLFSTFFHNDFFDKDLEHCLYDINETALNHLYDYLSHYNKLNPIYHLESQVLSHPFALKQEP